jgi:hypothetical protein
MTPPARRTGRGRAGRGASIEPAPDALTVLRASLRERLAELRGARRARRVAADGEVARVDWSEQDGDVALHRLAPRTRASGGRR